MASLQGSAATVADNFPRVRLGGFPTIAATRRQMAELMVSDCLAARAAKGGVSPKLVFSSNGQGVALAGEDQAFNAAMQAADIIHADGMSVVLASRFLTRSPLPERTATTDFFHDAAEAACAAGLKFYILGGKDAQNAKAVEAMLRMYPQLQIVGRRDGYFTDADDEAVCQEIVASGADVLWVALGKPKQEFWSVKNRERLKGLGWIKTCGGLYAFLAGDAPRAPDWMQNVGLEWLFRALKEPRRLAWRYVITNPQSIYRLFRYSR